MSFDKTEAIEADITVDTTVKSEMTEFVEKLFADEAATHFFIKKLFNNPDAIRALTTSFVSIYDMFSRNMQRASAGRFMDVYQVDLTTTLPDSTGFVEVTRKDGRVIMGSLTPEGTYLEYQDPDAALLTEVTRQFDTIIATLPIGTTFEELADFRAYAVITPRKSQPSLKSRPSLNSSDIVLVESESVILQ